MFCSALGNFLSVPGGIVLERMFGQQERVRCWISVEETWEASTHKLDDFLEDLQETGGRGGDQRPFIDSPKNHPVC